MPIIVPPQVLVGASPGSKRGSGIIPQFARQRQGHRAGVPAFPIRRDHRDVLGQVCRPQPRAARGIRPDLSATGDELCIKPQRLQHQRIGQPGLAIGIDEIDVPLATDNISQIIARGMRQLDGVAMRIAVLRPNIPSKRRQAS